MFFYSNISFIHLVITSTIIRIMYIILIGNVYLFLAGAVVAFWDDFVEVNEALPPRDPLAVGCFTEVCFIKG